MFWIRKFFSSRNKIFLFKKVLRLRSFRFVRELYYSIKHPEEQDLFKLAPRSQIKEKIVIVDIGAFEGNFASEIIKKYGHVKAYLIEPVENFVEVLTRKFSNEEVIIIPKALTVDGRIISLSDEGASSSSMDGNQTRQAESISVNEFVGILQEEIDLFQLNCEGGEYEILPALIETEVLKNIVALNIQFHYLSLQNILMRRKIHNGLRKTHSLVWSVPFIWERWELTENE